MSDIFITSERVNETGKDLSSRNKFKMKEGRKGVLMMKLTEFWSHKSLKCA